MKMYANFDPENTLVKQERDVSCEIILTEDFMNYYSGDYEVVRFIIGVTFENIEEAFLSSTLLPPHQLRSNLKPFCSDHIEVNDQSLTFQYYWDSDRLEGILIIDKPLNEVFICNTNKDLSGEVLQISETLH